MANRPVTVVFDVVETLMSLEPLRDRFSTVGLDPSALERWFDRMLRDGMALTLAGSYQPFPEVARETLRTISRGEIDDEQARYVLAGFAQLPAQPDAEPAMRTLSRAGIEVVCLSNGTHRTTVDFLDRTGLAPLVREVISAADVGQWKPPPQVYHYALARIGRPAREVALVAVHAFDCHGARALGITTGWSSRLEGHYGTIFDSPDVSGADLVEVAEGLAALPAG